MNTEVDQEPRVITVFLVDDHEVVLRGVAEMLNEEPDLRVIGQACSASEALVRIPALRPDVAVLDVRLPDASGVELCRKLRAELPDLKCLMLTSYADEQAMMDAILSGAAGHVLKDIKGAKLLSAIRTVGSGGSLLDSRATAAVLARLRAKADQPEPLAGLTEQERVLLGHIGEGLTNREIAARMFLSEKTVKNYVSRLLTKLGKNRTQAAVLAARLQGQLQRTAE
ncbi:putative transcriptional regulator, LuxR family protein [Saccharopolyspora subtropica]|uniref:Response regulator transcription factor n=1 Tax=Saccharopolyspora thermophila TaxID=89367 RepID=A0A917JPG2_9PSEU|nr:response regulator transcription factor [Saccharopolyspora subtropica]GGI80365.1 putative transcriptional regulator, LuxR family protein [Saccharopolyspora subtropica]